jgi:xylulokinase
MAVIGLDIGSTGCKCIVFRSNGETSGDAYLEYPKDISGTTISAKILWESVLVVLRQAITTYQSKCRSPEGNSEAIQAIGISSFGESFVAIDDRGNPLDDIMLYTDKRGLEECETLVAQIGEEFIMQSCGMKPHPMYSLPKIIWMRNHKPALFKKIYRFLLMEDFIIYRLTGKAFIDYSLAARTMAFDITRKCWNKDLLEYAGITTDQLSVPVPSGTAIGEITPDIADMFDLTGPVIVVTGGHDQVCAAVGAGILEKETAIDGIGTVECITPAFDMPILSPEFILNNYACIPYAIPGMYVTYAFNFTGGSLLKWFRDHFAAAEEIKAQALGMNVYRYLDEHLPQEVSDILVIPHFAGSGTPDMDPSATGTIAHLTFNDGVPQLYRAILEGVTFEMKYNMDLLQKAGVIFRQLSAVGGGSKSKQWLEIKAAITGCQILQLEVEEAGINGAAMLACVAIGDYPSLREAAAAFIKVKQIIDPSPQLYDIYKKKYRAYRQLRAKIVQ